MPTSPQPESEPAPDDVSSMTAGRDGGSFGPLSPDQIRRWAALIADGDGEFPAELSAPDRDRLVDEVRRRLRARLVTLVARAIAQDLYRREWSPDDPVAGKACDPGRERHGGQTV